MFQKILRFIGVQRTQNADQILRYPIPKRYGRESHGISQRHIDPDAYKVIQRIRHFRCEAYIVGGSIRDLLLGRKPKDFDIVTNAHPQELRKMFANSRIIGRRFRIVHVVFRGNKIIEVSTARSLPKNRKEAKNQDELYLKRDNQFGTFKEDAARRDFSMNSLFYDIETETIIDYTGGFEDIKNKIVRIIGNPEISFPEDPVRMYRAIKFSAMLDFDIDANVLRGIQRHKDLLRKASQARIHEEYNKIFKTGQSMSVFSALNQSGILKTLMPSLYKNSEIHQTMTHDEFEDSPLGRRLAIADRMIMEHEDVNFNIYYALIAAGQLLPIIRTSLKDHEKTLERKLKDPLAEIQKDIGLTRREYEKLLQIFSVQNLFRKDVTERKGWVKEFQNRASFQESFIVYKIIARSMGDDEALQKALFWEIGLRQKLPESIRRNAVHAVELDEIKPDAEPLPNQHAHQRPRHQGHPNHQRRRRRNHHRGGNRNPQNAHPHQTESHSSEKISE